MPDPTTDPPRGWLSRRSLGALGAWTACTLAVVALLGWDWRSAGAGVTELPGDPRSGEVLYQASCAACHGGDGRGAPVPGTDRTGPPLRDNDDVTIAFARLVLETGRMPPVGHPFDNRPRGFVLTVEQRRDVLAYLVSAFGLEGDVEDPGLGDAARGLELYAINCAACHGASGAGGVAGGGTWTPRIDQVGSQSVADAIRVGPFEMPRFAPEQLSDGDLADIAAFLDTVAEERSGLGLPELDPVFASGFAALLAFATLVLVWIVAGRPFRFGDHDDDTPSQETES